MPAGHVLACMERRSSGATARIIRVFSQDYTQSGVASLRNGSQKKARAGGVVPAHRGGAGDLAKLIRSRSRAAIRYCDESDQYVFEKHDKAQNVYFYLALFLLPLRFTNCRASDLQSVLGQKRAGGVQAGAA